MADERIGYYSPETAKVIAETVAYLRRSGFVQQKGKGGIPFVRGLNTCIFMTPAGGIPASSATKAGKAECQALRIDESDEYKNVTNNDGTNAIQCVYNSMSGSIAANKRIIACWSFGHWIAVAEDCG